MGNFKVGYFVGSLATKSINRLLAKALVGLAPEGLQMEEIAFKELPLYSYDYDANYPPVATAFKGAIASVDAVLFVTPEYNRSIPGGLDEGTDEGTRRQGHSADWEVVRSGLPHGRPLGERRNRGGEPVLRRGRDDAAAGFGLNRGLVE